MTSDSNILVRVLYQDQSIMDLIGDVICPNKKSRGENCVYLTRFEEFNKSTYECKLCKACSHVLNILFKDQKAYANLFCWTYCFGKRTKLDYQKKKLSPLMRQYIHQSNLSTTKTEEANNDPVPKKCKDISLKGLIVSRSYWLFYCNNYLLFSSIFKLLSN